MEKEKEKDKAIQTLKNKIASIAKIANDEQ
jgi:hypothetical protein